MSVTGKFSRYAATANADPESWLFCWLHLRFFLVRQWRLITLMTGLAVIASIAGLSVTPSRYTADTDLLVTNKKVSWIRSELKTEDGLVDDPSVETEIETIMSEKIAAAVARRLHLDEDQEFADPDASLWHRMLTLLKFIPEPGPNPAKEERTRRVLDTLSKNLEVKRLGRSSVERISYTSLNSEKAAEIANAFADAYIEDQLQARFETTRRSSVWLEQRMEELRQQASDAFRAVQDYKSQNNLIVASNNNLGGENDAYKAVQGGKPQNNLAAASSKLVSEIELEKLSEALGKTRADTSQARARLERIERVLAQRADSSKLDIPDPIVADALDNPVVTKLRQEFLDDQTKEAEWSSLYGSNHLAARKLRAEMAALQRAMWDELSRIAESYKSSLQIAKSREDSIEKQMAEVFQDSAPIRQQQVKLRELQTAANTYRNIYETFLVRFAQAVQQQSFPSSEPRILRPAAAGWRSWPNNKQMLGLATIYGLGFGFMAAFARERLSRRIHNRAELEGITGRSCLAILPAFTEKRWFFHNQGRKRETPAFRQISGAAPFSETAEALRFIKVAIDLHQARGNVIAFVSAQPGEGKTTVAAGFAAFVASNGNSTLLIDGDLRNPSMSRMLGYTNQPGLLNIVSGKSSCDDLIISDPVHKFDFLPASTRIKPPNSQDILNSPAMAQTLELARSRYDYVIIDLPPILPVADVKAAAHLFNAFVLIVEWGSTSADEILGALAASPTVSTRLVGTVLNKTDAAAIRRFES